MRRGDKVILTSTDSYPLYDGHGNMINDAVDWTFSSIQHPVFTIVDIVNNRVHARLHHQSDEIPLFIWCPRTALKLLPRFQFINLLSYEKFWDCVYSAGVSDTTSPTNITHLAEVTVYRAPTTADIYADANHTFVLYVDSHDRVVWKNDFDYNEIHWCLTTLLKLEVLNFLRDHTVRQRGQELTKDTRK